MGAPGKRPGRGEGRRRMGVGTAIVVVISENDIMIMMSRNELLLDVHGSPAFSKGPPYVE